MRGIHMQCDARGRPAGQTQGSAGGRLAAAAAAAAAAAEACRAHAAEDDPACCRLLLMLLLQAVAPNPLQVLSARKRAHKGFGTEGKVTTAGGGATDWHCSNKGKQLDTARHGKCPDA